MQMLLSVRRLGNCCRSDPFLNKVSQVTDKHKSILLCLFTYFWSLSIVLIDFPT